MSYLILAVDEEGARWRFDRFASREEAEVQLEAYRNRMRRVSSEPVPGTVFGYLMSGNTVLFDEVVEERGES